MNQPLEVAAPKTPCSPPCPRGTLEIGRFGSPPRLRRGWRWRSQRRGGATRCCGNIQSSASCHEPAYSTRSARMKIFGSPFRPPPCRCAALPLLVSGGEPEKCPISRVPLVQGGPYPGGCSIFSQIQGLGVRGLGTPHRFPNGARRARQMRKDRRLLSQSGNPPSPPALSTLGRGEPNR